MVRVRATEWQNSRNAVEPPLYAAPSDFSSIVVKPPAIAKPGQAVGVGEQGELVFRSRPPFQGRHENEHQRHHDGAKPGH